MMLKKRLGCLPVVGFIALVIIATALTLHQGCCCFEDGCVIWQKHDNLLQTQNNPLLHSVF